MDDNFRVSADESQFFSKIFLINSQSPRAIRSTYFLPLRHEPKFNEKTQRAHLIGIWFQLPLNRVPKRQEN